MDIRVTLQRLPCEEDSEGFAEFLRGWLEEEYRGSRLRVAIEFGEKFGVLVNGLENTESAWLAGVRCEEAAARYRSRRGGGPSWSLFEYASLGLAADADLRGRGRA